jgi:hypothetical protein
MDSQDEVNPELQSEYRGMVGSLMYLYQWTRPDLGGQACVNCVNLSKLFLTPKSDFT